jgi:ATP-dependent helicase HrpA
MNFKLIDEYGRQLEMSRNLSLLRTHFGGQARASFQEAAVPVSGSKITDMTRVITTWDFGELPELMELNKNGKKLFGYPALEAHETHCELSVWDEENVAKAIHLKGVLCLTRLQMKDTLKHLEKNIPDAINMGMLYTGLTQDSLELLRSEIVALALRRAANLDTAVPRNAADFDKLVNDAKGRLGLIVQEVARLVLSILSEWQNASKKLTAVKAYGNAYQDMTAQISKLTGKSFISQTPYVQLTHYPRYFNAIAMRVDKLKNDETRDGQMMRDMLPLIQNWQRVINERGADESLTQFRWMLEELRVGLFAQELRTPMPVSVKRLYKVWDSLQR